MSGGDSLSRMVLLLYAEGIEGGLYVSLNHTRASKYFHTGLRSRSRSRSRSESVVFLGVGVGVGVDKIYRLRPTPGKLLFLIHRNRHADYLRHFSAHIFCDGLTCDKYRTQPCSVLHKQRWQSIEIPNLDPTRSRCLKCDSWSGPGINTFCYRV